MHIAGKIFLGLGAVMLVVGGIMTATGGDTLSEIEWDVDGESVFEGPGGTYSHTSEDLMIIYVDDGVDCETFELTYTNETGAQGYDADTMDDSDGDGDPANDNDYPFFTKDDCDIADDGSDPAGYYSIGSFSGMTGESYDVEASTSFYTVPLFKTIGGVVEDAAEGFFAIIGGVGRAGCGVCSLLLGGLLALVLKDDKPQTMVVNQMQQ